MFWCQIWCKGHILHYGHAAEWLIYGLGLPSAKENHHDTWNTVQAFYSGWYTFKLHKKHLIVLHMRIWVKQRWIALMTWIINGSCNGPNLTFFKHTTQWHSRKMMKKWHIFCIRVRDLSEGSTHNLRCQRPHPSGMRQYNVWKVACLVHRMNTGCSKENGTQI